MYITIHELVSSQEDGVARKLISKIEAIRSEAENCMLLNATINLSHNDVILLEKNSLYTNIEIGVKNANNGYFNKIKIDMLFYDSLADYIIENSIGCDRIMFRYPFASLGLKSFTKRFRNKIIFEHNTKELEELKVEASNKKYVSFSLRPSKFFYWLQEKKYPLYCEKYISKYIFKNAVEGVCVTSEIALYERNRNKGYTTFVSSNFYNVSKASLSVSHYEVGKSSLTCGMIVTTTAPWYGLERLFKSFAPVQDQYRLIIAGVDKNNNHIQKLLQEYNIEKNIDFLGRINKQQLVSFYNTVHVCFGSLGLYKINLQYASTLKVKESVSYGIPVVIAYNEEDFVNSKDFDGYYLQIENNDKPINFDEVKQFVVRFYSDSANKNRLRELAFKYLDTTVKIKALICHITPVAYVD